MSELPGSELILTYPDPEDGNPFGSRLRKSSGLLDDVIVVEVPKLAIIDFEDFVKVMAMRPEVGTVAPRAKGYSLHPFRGKWKCPRCAGSHNLNINPRQHWMRCAGATTNPYMKEMLECDAAPIDLAVAESLFFKALESFAVGRAGNFADMARRRYDEVVGAAQADRKQAKERADYLRAEIRLIGKELVRAQDNRYIRDGLQADADELGAELERLEETLQDFRAEPEDPDPETSLLDLNNMIDMMRTTTPFGFAVNLEALQLRNRLHDVLLDVTMVEKGDDLYDVEFRFDVARAFDAAGKQTEIVFFKDQYMKAGYHRRRRRLATFEGQWKEGGYKLSDRAWKKRPSLPNAERQFGDDLRWMIDTMIMTAETGMGTRAIVRAAGSRVSRPVVQLYRASKECVELQDWLRQVRPRKHDYLKMIPTPKTPTLRERMEKNGHPLLELDRVHPSSPPSPLTDVEFEGLVAVLPAVLPQWRNAIRERVDQTLEMLRANRYTTWKGKRCYGSWYNAHVKRGTFLLMVNYLRSLEGKPPCNELPAVPTGRAGQDLKPSFPPPA